MPGEAESLSKLSSSSASSSSGTLNVDDATRYVVLRSRLSWRGKRGLEFEFVNAPSSSGVVGESSWARSPADLRAWLSWDG